MDPRVKPGGDTGCMARALDLPQTPFRIQFSNSAVLADVLDRPCCLKGAGFAFIPSPPSRGQAFLRTQVRGMERRKALLLHQRLAASRPSGGETRARRRSIAAVFHPGTVL